MDGVAPNEFFSGQLRYAIATFLFVIAAYSLALLYQHIDASGALGSPKISGHNLHSLSFHLCALILALAGLWLLLFVSAAAYSTPNLHPHYLFFWVEFDFVSASWTGMSWASVIAFFVIFPFAFLYDEAEGIASHSGFVARVVETACVQLLGAILFHGSLGLVQYFLTGQRLGIGFFTNGYALQLPGLFVYLVYYREGFRRLILGAVSIFDSWPARNDPDQITAYEFSLEAVLQQIETLNQTEQYFAYDANEKTSLEDLQRQLRDLQKGHADACRRRSLCHTLLRNILASVLLLLSILLPLGLTLRSIMKCERMFSEGLRRVFGWRIMGFIHLLILPLSVHPIVTFIFDVSLVMYLLVAVASAAFDSASFKWAAGFYGHVQSPTQELLTRNTFILLLCSTLPVVTSLLGLTQIEIEKVFPDPKRYSSLIYCMAFLFLQLVTLLECFGLPVSKSVIFFGKIICCCCCCMRCRRIDRHTPVKPKIN